MSESKGPEAPDPQAAAGATEQPVEKPIENGEEYVYILQSAAGPFESYPRGSIHRIRDEARRDAFLASGTARPCTRREQEEAVEQEKAISVARERATKRAGERATQEAAEERRRRERKEANERHARGRKSRQQKRSGEAIRR